MTALGVRRGKAALSSGCKSHPAIAPAGSNRSSHRGDEMAEAFGIACHALVSLDFRCGSRLFSNSGLDVKLSVDAPAGFTVLSAVGAEPSA